MKSVSPPCSLKRSWSETGAPSVGASINGGATGCEVLRFEVHVNLEADAHATAEGGQLVEVNVAVSNNGECFAGAAGVPGDQTVVANPFPGSLDDIRIYNRALAASEIAAIYGAGTNGMCAPAPLRFAGPPVYNRSNGISLSATLRSGQSYTLESSTNLTATNWVVVTNFIAGTAPIAQLTESIVTNISQQFYRITSP